MYIDRVTIAKLLQTKESNIRSTKLSGEVIQVCLWNREIVTVTVQQYMGCLKQRFEKAPTSEGLQLYAKHHTFSETDIEQIFTNTTLKRYEYLIVRYDYKGRGITGEFNFLDINGRRVVDFGGQGNTLVISETWSLITDD